VDDQQVAVLSPGEYFGEGALLTTNPRRASIIAMEETCVSWLDRDAFRQLLGEQLVETLQSDFNAKEKGLEKEVSGSDLERLSVLGVGAFGTVSLVRNRVTGETYALKQIRKATVVKTEQEAAVQNERDILRIVHNVFVVNLLSTYQDTTCVFMVLECALGGELFTIILNAITAKQVKPPPR
jgi:CRP-like cAMP-binding protein